MTRPQDWIAIILGVGLLMFVHEGGHYLAARAFGMRVTKFSIGMPPVLFRFQPKKSPTVFQIGAIPFFAFVQIAGMNPFEEVAKDDRGSYANASLLGRIVTIFAGPFFNYAFACLVFFGIAVTQGDFEPRVEPLPQSAAEEGGIKPNDLVVAVAGRPVENFDAFREAVSARPGQPTEFVVTRGTERVVLTVTPKPTGGVGRIGARPSATAKRVPAPVGAAAKAALLQPVEIVLSLPRTIVRSITGKEKLELSGPVGMMSEGARAASEGVARLFTFLAFVSASLAAFNLLPFPALDGGRLVFLGYEAISRRRASPMIEAHVHLVGFLALLGLMLAVTWKDLFRRSQPEAASPAAASASSRPPASVPAVSSTPPSSSSE